MKIRKATKATQVTDQIRSDIICGKFSAGEKLQMDDLKQRYGIGYTPLREALSKLSSDGFVAQEQQCGFSVASVSVEELEDLYQVRAHIESLALQMAIEYGDAQWEAEVLGAWHVFKNHLDPKSPIKLSKEEWEQIQSKFYNTLFKACRSPWLLKIQHTLYNQAARYRGICIESIKKNPASIRDYINNLQALVNACISRDTDKALRLSRLRWKNTVKAIKDKLFAKDG